MFQDACGNNSEGWYIANGNKEKRTFFGADCGEEKLAIKKRIHLFQTGKISQDLPLPFS